MKPYKILNLYAGIGGNRKLWTDVEVTAVEIDANIAKVYQNLFPDDKVIVGDAHQYLLDHYKEFDFIWSSPPCPTHSKMCFARRQKKYPDMSLWQEIIFLKSWFGGKYVVENVIPYYEPITEPSVVLGRHTFWSNFNIPRKQFSNIDVTRSSPDKLFEERGVDPSIFNIIKEVPENRSMHNRFDRRQIVRNMVNPEMANYILNCAREITEPIQEGLFETHRA